VLRALFKSPTGIVGAIGLVVIALIAIFAPIFLGHQAASFDVAAGLKGPSAKHWLGTDQLGHDILLQLLVATRITILLALGATGVGALIGLPMGAGSAILPPRLRTVALRGIDALIAFPGLLIAIIFGAILGPGKLSAVLGVGVALSFAFARVTSSLTLSIRDREFVAAARVIGVRRLRLMFRHVVPNIADTLAIATTISIASSVVTIAGLSFLGLGVQVPQTDWGRMLTQGVSTFYLTPAAAVGPGVAIVLTALVFGFVGEGLARAFNPALWATSGQVVKLNPVTGTPSIVVADDAHDGAVTNALAVTDLQVEFGTGDSRYPVVRGVSFTLDRGETIGIVGESGSGKTLTAMAIAQLIPYPGRVTGRIDVNGQDLQAMPLKDVDRLLGTKLAVVFQDPMSALNPALRIGRQLTEGVRFHRRLGRAPASSLARRRLAEVNLATPARQMRRYPHEFSGGQRQRILIAMGLMNEPVLLIADEPTTALDVTVQAQIMDLLAGVNSEHGTAIILISHNLGLISQNCHRILVMYAGRVVEELTADQLRELPLHPYTRALLGAVPDMSQSRSQPLVSIPGQIPEVTSAPPGCAYNPRCEFVQDRCKVERPPLLQRPDGHRVACWVANEQTTAVQASADAQPKSAMPAEVSYEA
jgi:peptide/nickel transport system permease protein